MAPAVASQRVKSERALFMGDIHVPFHDVDAVALVWDFARWFRPDVVWLNGDIMDCYQLSRFSKDPRRLLKLQDDLDTTQRLLGDLRKAVGKDCRIEFIAGNHSHRLLRYLWDHPEIAALDNLTIPALLNLPKLHIGFTDYNRPVEWHGLLIEHGDRVRNKSAFTAAGMLDVRGVSGISNHTHRMGSHFRTNRSGVRVWYENGCLCQLTPEYAYCPDWQHGFSIGYAVDGAKRFIIEQVPIVKHRLYYSGILWSA